MNILLTGANGYIGKRLLPILLDNGHTVYACVRDNKRFALKHPNLRVVEVDFLQPSTLSEIPRDIDAAYYLIHSMSNPSGNFEELETRTAQNFIVGMRTTSVQQVIYLSGIINDTHLSRHLASRKNVEDILKQGSFNLTTLRAGIILGSGSASFEIIRDLVEKLPIMVTPKWLLTKSQPIAIRNVVQFLNGVLLNSSTFNQSFDIGGPDILTYKEMLLRFAYLRKLKRHIFVLPVLTPRLSSYWLYFVTSTSYQLAVNLVNSMKVEVIASPNNLAKMLGIKLLSFDEAISIAFEQIENDNVLSSWKDALNNESLSQSLFSHLNVPTFGCYTNVVSLKTKDTEQSLHKIWMIGGDTGWYYANWLWLIRGFIDKLLGGIGLRRGRTNINSISMGDALDFWRVLIADKDSKRLLLFAEMKLPGEAWLEFTITEAGYVKQTATFRPKGVLGRLYWFTMVPFHYFIFKGMAKGIANNN